MLNFFSKKKEAETKPIPTVDEMLKGMLEESNLLDVNVVEVVNTDEFSPPSLSDENMSGDGSSVEIGTTSLNSMSRQYFVELTKYYNDNIEEYKLLKFINYVNSSRYIFISDFQYL